jgi:hypothetical protein
MKIYGKLKWHARKAGGLFLGMRVSFPCMVLFEVGNEGATEAWYLPVRLGLLVATVEVDFFYGIAPAASI